MKNLLNQALLFCLLLTAAPAQAQPGIKSPQEMVPYFAERFNAGDIQALLKLYEPGALFIPSPGKSVTTPADRKQALVGFIGLGLPLVIKARHVYQQGDLALIITDWTMDGVAKDGNELHLKGSSTDVIRRQKNGTWLYAIDNPYGSGNPPQAE